MPNSLDEEETQCLLACEDNLTSTYCDDVDQDDIEAHTNHDTRKCTNSQTMNSSSSSNELHLLSNNLDAHTTTPNITNSSIAAASSFIDANHTVVNSNASSKDAATSEYVVPTLGNYQNSITLVA